MANLKTPTPAKKKKLLNPKEDPPNASSSDEEVETSSGEDEEQISDSKIHSTQTLKSSSAFSAAAKEDSGSDSGSETGSDSESEPPEKAVSVSTAKQDSGSETDSGSEPEPPEKAVSVNVTPLKSKKKEVNASPAVKSVKKRGNEGASTEVKAKRAKKVSGDEEEKKSGEDNKKPPFQRLWSEEDEISLLQGMIDFKAETGTSPYDDMNGFYDKVKKCISFDASKSQFSDKIRGLKKNYIGGRKKSLDSAHDKKCLGLVKYIWGSDGLGLESAGTSLVKSKKVESGLKSMKTESEVVVKAKEVKSDLGVKSNKVESDGVVKSKGKGKTVESKVEKGKVEELSSWFENSFLVPVMGSLGVNEVSVKSKWSKVPWETKKIMEEKFKVVEAKDYESLLLKADLLKEMSTLISEAI